MSSTPKFRRENSGASDLRAPPHSIEAEQAVLGGLMLDRAAWDNVGDVVTADDFFRPDHRSSSRALRRWRARRSPAIRSPSPSTCSDSGKLQEVGGLAYLGTLTRDTPGAANARAYAEIVKERALLRALVTTGGEIAGSVWSEEGESARELVEQRRATHFRDRRGQRARQGLRERAPGAAGADRPDRRSLQQPQQAARPAHGLHRFRLQDRRTARRRSADHRGPSLDG